MPCAHCPSSDVAYWLSGLSTLVNIAHITDSFYPPFLPVTLS